MSTYVVGDIQGCYDEFRTLLDTVQFEPDIDHLWCVGDMVNRGPNNVGVLETIMSLPNVTCVLGNHDLHFLAVAAEQQTLKRPDTLADLLNHPRRDEFVDYLRHLPLIYQHGDLVMVHAGLPPQFDLTTCLQLAKEVEDILKSDNYPDFLKAMYGNTPSLITADLKPLIRLRVIANYFTRLRFCKANGEMNLTHKTDIAPAGFSPWFDFPRTDTHVLFGHWAALEGHADAEFVTALDTGCVWGRTLTALRLEDKQLFSVEALA